MPRRIGHRSDAVAVCEREGLRRAAGALRRGAVLPGEALELCQRDEAVAVLIEHLGEGETPVGRTLLEERTASHARVEVCGDAASQGF